MIYADMNKKISTDNKKQIYTDRKLFYGGLTYKVRGAIFGVCEAPRPGLARLENKC